MANNKDFKVKNGIQPTVYHEGVGTVTSGSEGYSLSSASYDSVSFSVAAQDTNANGFIFNATGTKLYVVGRTNRSIFQYSLSTAYDISTASYDSVSFSVAAQETNPIEAFFKSDGTKLYVIGWDGDAVFQYGLTTAYDISTASYDSVSFSFASQDTVAASIYFKPDGTKFYIMGAINDAVFQYSLSTAWDMSTASYDSVSFSFSSQETNPYGLLFNNDGTKMFITGNTSDATFQYSLTTAWDLSTASYDSVSLDHTTVMTDPFGTRFNSDGSKFYVVASNDTLYQYSTTLTTKSLDLSTGSVFEITPTSDIQVNLSNPADSGTVSQATLLLDGALLNAWDISTASYSQNFSVSTQGGTPSGLFFKPDGTKMYVTDLEDYDNDDVNEYNLSTAWDVSTASYSQNFSLGSDREPRDIFFKPDGTKVFVVNIRNGSNQAIWEYALSTAWDISTASFSDDFSISNRVSEPQGLFFHPDGTSAFVVGDTSNDAKVHLFTLSTAWDLTTASTTDTNFWVGSQETSPQGIFFKSDGTTMFIVGASGDDVNEYNLSTSWDISTASYVKNFSVSSQDNDPQSIFFKPDGARMYILGNQLNNVNEYSLGTPATITYPSTLEWPSGTAPTSPAIGETDVITISTTDGGTSYQAVQAIDGAK